DAARRRDLRSSQYADRSSRLRAARGDYDARLYERGVRRNPPVERGVRARKRDPTNNDAARPELQSSLYPPKPFSKTIALQFPILNSQFSIGGELRIENWELRIGS